MRFSILCLLLTFRMIVFAQDTTQSVISEIKLDSVTQARIDSLKHDAANSPQGKMAVDTTIAEKTKKQKKIDTTHYSPKKAALLALACPGLGQIYNKKYWKLPIVYGLMGGAVYFVTHQAMQLRKFNGYLTVRENGGQDPYFDILTLDELVDQRDFYRRNVQLASFATMFVWGLSIVDAVVDAHLHAFDINDKLSLQIKPNIGLTENERLYAGLNINLKLK